MITLIYPIKNRVDLFSGTITSIRRYAMDIADKFEIIVLDSGSTDSVKSFCMALKNDMDLTYVTYNYPNCNKRHGPTYAINLGAKLSKYDSIVLTSPEIRHDTDVIKQLIPLVGRNLTSSVLDLKPDGSPSIRLVSPSFRSKDPGMYFIGMYSKADFWSIGGIDEKFMQGEAFEDTDFGVRFLRVGLKHEYHDEIRGAHQYHPRVKRGEKMWGINKRIYETNNMNKVTLVNEGITAGDPKYITSKS